jgi:hypothetical protein
VFIVALCLPKSVQSCNEKFLILFRVFPTATRMCDLNAFTSVSLWITFNLELTFGNKKLFEEVLSLSSLCFKPFFFATLPLQGISIPFVDIDRR